MLRVGYHIHTDHSYDSTVTAEAALRRARSAGIDVLCVTDHDTIEGALRLRQLAEPGVRVVVGCEFTSEDGSHVIGLELREMIADRRLPHLLEQIKLQGGVVVLPHLFRRGSGIFRSEARRSDAFVREVLALTDVVECFNHRDVHEHNIRSQRFALAHGLPTVAGSDAHRAEEIGAVYVEYVEASFAHGRSPRRIFFPAQRPRTENAAKRRVMELYHAHSARLPAAVDRAYRRARAWLRSDGPRGGGEPELQYDLTSCGDALPRGDAARRGGRIRPGRGTR